jgi:T5SS/PEP-CTERM-associated repeat protein
VSLTVPGALVVGDSGTGTLQVTAGTNLDGSAGTLTIGAASDGVGVVTVSGADAASSLGGLIIGGSGDGTLAIDSGATVTTSDSVVVGQAGDGFGTLTLNGDSSSFVDGGDLLVGASGDGTVSVQGGATLEVNSGAVVIGAEADASGVVTLAGTDTPLQVGKDLTVGQSGDGTLDVQSGVTLNVNSGTVTIGAAQGGSGEVILAGILLTAKRD